MEFFGNGRRYQQQPYQTRRPFSQSPSFRSVPVYQVNPTRETPRPGPPIHRPSERNPTRETPRPGPPIHRPSERNQTPKVVRIPVQFVGSEKPDRSRSALKIQKVFRGFLVRKYLKKINDIKVQVDEIDGKLSNGEIVELVRRNEKERLRFNESLMCLLIKLDSISGLDVGVRVCRKAVIRKAIALQERLDSIVAAADSEGCNGETVDEKTEMAAFSEDSVGNQEILGGEICEEDGGNNSMEIDENDGEDDVIDVGVDREVKVTEVNCVDEDLDAVKESVECVKERLSERDEKGKLKDGNGGEDEGSKRNREMMEQMMEGNAKMMGLMMQLLERNESQTKLLNAMTHRVELLEKAFLCDKLRKKKKKKAKGGDAACL